jgi:polar amino acid transport system substrate-binding protein
MRGTSDRYKFKTLEDIIGSNVTLGVIRGYYYGDTYEALIENDEFSSAIEEVSWNELNYRKLARGRIDGFIEDPVSAVAGLRKVGMLDQVEIHPMYIFSNDIHIMFSKNKVPKEYVEKFNKSLKVFKASQEYTDILNKYLKR